MSFKSSNYLNKIIPPGSQQTGTNSNQCLHDETLRCEKQGQLERLRHPRPPPLQGRPSAAGEKQQTTEGNLSFNCKSCLTQIMNHGCKPLKTGHQTSTYDV